MEEPIIPKVNLFISFRELGELGGVNQVVDILARLNVANAQRFELNFFYDRTLTFHRYDEYLSQQLFAADVVIVLNTRKYAADPYILAHEKPWIELAANNPSKEVVVLQIGPLSEAYHWPETLAEAHLIPYADQEVFYSNPNVAGLWADVERDLLDLIATIAERKKTEQLERLNAELPVIVLPIEEEAEELEETTTVFSMLMMAAMVLIVVGYLVTEYTGFDPLERVSDATPITFNQETGRQGGRSYPAPLALAGIAPTSVSYSKVDSLQLAGNIPSMGDGSSARGRDVYLPSGYGRYESCQGRDAQGNRPCKKNRRWYLVNEARNIHHQINFTERTHKDIYAIRPFRDGLAQVYFYDGRRMYLEFCVGLDDRVVECVLRP
ncbi:MAG: hypothetical protein AAF840_05960 [Bacteroidota bacterium]